MDVAVEHIDLHVLNMHTRMPFRYGIASLTALPHLFVRVTLETGGKTTRGLASDGLAPKWFTKNPDTSFEEDMVEMIAVIRSAAKLAEEEVKRAPSVFDFWLELHGRQREWARGRSCPPLLSSFGVSLVERAVIDACCRAEGVPFHRALLENRLGIRLSELHPELAGAAPGDLLPPSPRKSIRLRHTIGLGDPLTEADIPPEHRLTDGLPQSLEACIEAGGLTHFKIKLSGDLTGDVERLGTIAHLLERRGGDYAFTLDGNEYYREVAPFRAMWKELTASDTLRQFLKRLIFVEQPFHRDVALGEPVVRALGSWDNRPPLIIDESDGELGSARQALFAGYAGTSHKNCKGVMKGVANACYIEHLRQQHREKAPPGRALHISGEDLANVGPVALLSDLAVMAALGMEHVERNGHHYFLGLSMYPAEVQEAVLEAHGDLYRRHGSGGYPALHIAKGQLDLTSVNAAPFGTGIELDPSLFTPLSNWSFSSLGLSD